MSSPFAYLLSAARRADKAAKKMAASLENNCDMTYQELYDLNLNIEFKAVTREIKLMQKLKEYINEDLTKLLTNSKPAMIQDSAHWYLITIRPADNSVDFNVFRAKVEQFLQRKMFINYHYSFEQKGTSYETLGGGFHVHIVAQCTQSSKGNVLRDTLSTFKKWIEQGHLAANCVDVRPVSNPDELVQKYLIDYVSDDEHKSVTKEWDTRWRVMNNLREIYSLSLSPSSPEGDSVKIEEVA